MILKMRRYKNTVSFPLRKNKYQLHFIIVYTRGSNLKNIRVNFLHCRTDIHNIGNILQYRNSSCRFTTALLYRCILQQSKLLYRLHSPLYSSLWKPINHCMHNILYRYLTITTAAMQCTCIHLIPYRLYKNNHVPHAIYTSS